MRAQRKILTFKNVDFMDIDPASQELFQPFNGLSFIPTRVTTRTRTVTGVFVTQPQFKITDGTNDIVAAAANMNANAGRAKNLTVITDREATYAAPLTLTKTVAAAGGTVFKGDIIIEGVLVG